MSEVSALLCMGSTRAERSMTYVRHLSWDAGDSEVGRHCFLLSLSFLRTWQCQVI